MRDTMRMYKRGWLQALLDEHRPDTKLAELGRYLGLARDIVSKINRGERKVQSEEIDKIADFCGLTVEAFMTAMNRAANKPYREASINQELPQKGHFTRQTKNENIKSRDVQAGLPNLPVYGSAEGGRGGMIIDTEIQWLERPLRLAGVEGAYALRVNGDSVYPAFPHGNYVYVHPALPLTPGRGVVVQFLDHEAVVKIFRRWTDDSLEVEELHPEPRSILIPRDSILATHRIVGTIEP